MKPQGGSPEAVEDRNRTAWVAPTWEILAAKPTDKAAHGGVSEGAGRNDE
jgi:hypothetical protein